MCLFLYGGTISGSQGRKECVSWCLNPYQVDCMCLSGGQDFIHLLCDHQEMPGKCFNLPTVIRNASTLNQPAQISSQSKYSTCFLARPPQWVCTALSLFLFAPKLFWHWPQMAAYIADIPRKSAQSWAACVCEIFITYILQWETSPYCSGARH